MFIKGSWPKGVEGFSAAQSARARMSYFSCTYACVRAHVHMNACTHVCVSVCMHGWMYERACLYVHATEDDRMYHVHMHACMRVSTYVFTSCVCMYVFVFVHVRMRVSDCAVFFTGKFDADILEVFAADLQRKTHLTRQGTGGISVQRSGAEPAQGWNDAVCKSRSGEVQRISRNRAAVKSANPERSADFAVCPDGVGRRTVERAPSLRRLRCRNR